MWAYALTLVPWHETRRKFSSFRVQYCCICFILSCLLAIIIVVVLSQTMVQTWKSSWFADEGTRLLYLVPRAQTDAILPLHVTPTPTETVRVMVGRLEAMTPEQDARLRGLGHDTAFLHGQRL